LETEIFKVPTKKQFTHLLFSAIEREITSFIRDEISSPEFWPETIYLDSLEKMKNDPRSAIGERTFVDYLYFQQKLEAVARNSHQFQMTPAGESIVQNLDDLFKLNGIRNDVAHPKPLGDEDIEFIVVLSRSLVQIGFGESEISQVLKEIEGISEPGSSLKSNIVSDVLNNLPSKEYDDTGFVGRNKLIGQIVKDLKSKSSINSYIWLTGLGGFGKTAIAREVANRLLWDKDKPFDLILWVSFKTHELTSHGIERLRDALISASDSIQEFPLFTTDSKKTLHELFAELEQLETLIIFDNCETYPGEIEEITQANPPSSIKFLFTSRRRGEFGRTISIEKMEFDECRHFLVKLNKSYPSIELDNLVKNPTGFATILQLVGMAPLGIKWLARACNTGMNIDAILQKRESLLRYCVENVYNGLSQESRKVLNYLQISRSPLSIGDLKVLLENFEAQDLLTYISDLTRVGLVKKESTEYRSVFTADETTRDFLILTNQISDQERKELEKSFRKISKRSPKVIEDFFSPYTVDGRKIEPLVSNALAQFLLPKNKQKRTRDELINEANQFIESAPKYWETYRVLGEIYWWFGEKLRAVELIEQAIAVCPSDLILSRSRLHYFLSVKLTEIDEIRASAEAQISVQLNECYETVIHYGRLLVYQNKNTEGEEELKKAYSYAYSARDKFYAAWAILRSYKRRCESLQGEDLFYSSRFALNFWLSTTELLWDCPAEKHDDVLDDVLETLRYFCEGYQSSSAYGSTAPSEFSDTLSLMDDALVAWHNPNWLSTRLNGKYRTELLNKIKSITEALPSLSPSLRLRIDRSLENAELKDVERISSPLKIWYVEKRYGFLKTLVNGNEIDVFIPVKNLVRASDEEKLKSGKPLVSGVVIAGDKGYFLTGIRVE
jgi:tetratricopeptide (TPR) repeat protein